MSETVETVVEEEIPEAVREEIEKVVKDTKRGFDLKERLKGRGLRKATVVLFLDEDKGPELGWAYDQTDQFNNLTGRRIREGVIGELDLAQTNLEAKKQEFQAQHAAWEALGLPDGMTELDRAKSEPVLDTTIFDEAITALEAKRDELTKELTRTALTLKMRAVPAVIQKDTRRRAKHTLGITGKTIPDEMIDNFALCQTAHMITVIVQSVTDNETEEVNVGLTYEDAIALMDYLPVGQYQRLTNAISILQFTDAISRDIEGQEDFS